MANTKTKWKGEEMPRFLLAIDPGAHFKSSNPHYRVPYAGCALFLEGILAWAALVKCPHMVGRKMVTVTARPFALVRKVCEEAGIARYEGEIGKRGRNGEPLTSLAVEKPILYKKGTARPKDIIDLREIFGAFIGGIEAELYATPTPSTWKGTIDGDILNERVLDRLEPYEKSMLSMAQRNGADGLSDHVLDAVGIGLFTLGRAGVAMEKI